MPTYTALTTLMGEDAAEALAEALEKLEPEPTGVGVFEIEDYAAGTQAVARAVATSTGAGAVSIIGGGDSAAAVEQMGLDEKMTHVSTGGGAALEYLKQSGQIGTRARFDVVAIDDSGAEPEIEIVKNAFPLAYG